MTRCSTACIFAVTNHWEYSVADGSPMSWWLDREGERRSYWGGFLPGVQQCSCSLEENCMDMNYFCNCDADTDSWYVSEMTPTNLSHFRKFKTVGMITSVINMSDRNARF